MPYDIDAIRKRLKDSTSGRFNDPDEFKPEKATSQVEPLKYRFYILAPVQAGDKLKSGIAKRSMDQFFVAHGNHWVDNKPYPCPRVWDNTECDMCANGFALLSETKEKEARSAIMKTWMPAQFNMVNIYFPAVKTNPEALHNTVKYYNAPKTCLDIWASTLLKNDPGDEDDPNAFGVFFDENAAFLFELQIIKQGQSNSYKTSKFIANKGIPMPMVRTADGKPNEKAIAALLTLRHNLFDKIEVPNPQKISSLANKILKGDDGDDKNDGFDHDEETIKEPVAKKAVVNETKTTTKANTKKAKEPDPDDDDVISQLNAANSLENEAPLKTEVKTSVTSSKPEKTEPKVEESKAEDSDDDDIQALLSQLEDAS